jgi:hypothetical protein
MLWRSHFCENASNLQVCHRVSNFDDSKNITAHNYLAVVSGGQDYGHYLDGDGYLTRVTIDNGKVIDTVEQL